MARDAPEGTSAAEGITNFELTLINMRISNSLELRELTMGLESILASSSL